MSIQFGHCNFDETPADLNGLDRVRPLLAPFGPDAEGLFCRDQAVILCRAFHTTREARQELQPYLSPSGLVITLDGRLDNRDELLAQLQSGTWSDSSDVSIVSAAFERWGTNCLPRLLGDWALSVWDVKRRKLILAKDFAGVRHLYYSVSRDRVIWCTILDPGIFALPGGALDEEYLAGWLGFMPATHLSPYAGIRSVPPGTFVLLESGREKPAKFWDFDSTREIRYRTDAEYEEHFRIVFADAVRRRLRSDGPILAELSGGMDSSSVVCVADDIVAGCRSDAPRLDTLSYYDDSEPNWNELPYISKVEARRGRTGHHIDLSQEFRTLDFLHPRFSPTPNPEDWPSEARRRFAACIGAHGYRVLLSGIGGDELMGGVPTPIPELQNLLVEGRLLGLAQSLKLWASHQRRPWVQLLAETVRGFLPRWLSGVPPHLQPAPWIRSDFVKRHRDALSGYVPRLLWLGPPPSFQHNADTLDGLRRQLAACPLSASPLRETRYPYLDRSLWEFVCAIPREQLVRPGQRRSLMRRALMGVVPLEVMNRRRKAFVSRAPRITILNRLDDLLEMSGHMISDSLQIVDQKLFSDALRRIKEPDSPIIPILRTIAVETWLKNLCECPLLKVRNVQFAGDLGHEGGTETAHFTLEKQISTPRRIGDT